MPLESENALLIQTDRVICHCYRVTESTIRDAIDTLGAANVAEIQARTCAGGGCNACHCRLRRMLAGESATCSPFVLCNECGFNTAICTCRVA